MGFASADERVNVNLSGLSVQMGERWRGLGRAGVPIESQALVDEEVEGPHRLLDGRLDIRPVRQDDVHVIHL